MKRRNILVFGLIALSLLSFGSGVVISQTSGDLPRLTKACETKAGLLFGIDDGFSILKKCPGNSRKVVLGEKSESGGVVEDELKMNYNNIAFGGSFVLTKDGRVWKYNPITNTDWGVVEGWLEHSESKLPQGITVTDIREWDGSTATFFITKNGDLYNYFEDGLGWVKMSDVVLN